MIAGMTTLFTFGQQQNTNGKDGKKSSGLVKEVQISGSVTYADGGEPMIGATIIVKGTNKGSSTDVNGKYSLNVPPDAILQFKYLGCTTQEIAVGNQRVIDVVMNSEIQHKYKRINDEYLEPVSEIHEYYSKIHAVLFNGLTDSPEIRILVIPSFTPENVLDIDFDRENNKYYLKYNICDKRIIDRVWAIKFCTEIDKKSVDLIKSLFGLAIDQAKFPPPVEEGEMILSRFDGDDYYFTVNEYEYGIKSGKVWSPSRGTKMSKLVAVGNKLIELAKSKKDIVKIDEMFQREIEDLIDELKN